MKILVTGGAGFIASHVVDAYLKEGHQVVIVDNLSTGKKDHVPPQVSFYHLGIESPEILQILEREKPDVVNHHAAQIDVRKSVDDPCADALVNIVGSLNLFESARKSGVKKFIFASTGGAIYGEQDAFPADEAHRTDPMSPYGIAKLSVEKYLQFYFWTYEIPFVSLRYANIYGPRQNAHGEAGVVAIFTEKLLKGETPVINGDGTQTRDYVFVEDVVACNLEALKEGVKGIFNVGTGVETDVNTLAGYLLKLTGSNQVIPHAPPKPGEQKRSLIKPGALQQNSPVSLQSGLEKTVEWFSR